MSTLTGRKTLAGRAGQHFNGDRDLYAAMGYPPALGPQDYTAAYARQDIAARIVDAYPDATWRESPIVVGNEPLAEAMEALDDRLSIWRTLHRADRLMGLGHYGALLIGLDGGEPLIKPARGRGYGLLYVQPHSERTAQITRWCSDPGSPRFGKPEIYDMTTGVNWTGAGAGQTNQAAHYSRVIHIAERALEDESIGTPRLERIWNRLMDLDKLLGGSAEMYWQNVAMLMQLKADIDVEWDPEEEAALRNQIDDMQHGLSRWMRTRGIEANNLAPGLQGADPGNHIDRQMDAIAGAVGIPKRILLGSEAGQLASSQDENNWAGRVSERRQQFAGPSIARAFIVRMQELGVLPAGEFTLEWSEGDTLGEAGRADVALKTAQAVSTYANSPGAEQIISVREFRKALGQEGETPDIGEDDILEDSDEAVIQFNQSMAR